VCGKIHDFNLYFSDGSFHSIALTETWLHGGILDGELLDESYSIYRRDRDRTTSSKTRGGGVLVAVKSTCFSSRRRIDFETAAEIVWVEILLGRHRLYVSSIYFPPDGRDIVLDELGKSLDLVSNVIQPGDHILLCGDFNLPDIIWTRTEDGTLEPERWTSARAEKFLNCFIYEHALFQLVDERSCNDHYLDLIMCTTDNARTMCIDPAVNSIHRAIVCELHVTTDISSLDQCSRTVYNYRKADFDHLKRLLAILPWSLLSDCTSVDESVDLFYDLLFSAINDCVPKVNVKKRKYPDWFDIDLICLLREKERAWRKLRQSRSEVDRTIFSKLRSEFKSVSKAKHSEYILDMETQIKCNSKRFWGFVKKKRNSSTVPNCMFFNDTQADNPASIAESFNSFFQSVFTKDDDTDLPPFDTRIIDQLCAISFNYIDTLQVLLSIDTNKAVGPDNVSGLLLKECAHELAVPLTIIFNRSLCSGVFPEMFSKANVAPVFKAGDRTDVTNYRPISLLPLISKLFEKLVHSHVFNHVKMYINDCQHGFVKGRSTQTNLACYVDFISESMDSRTQVDSVYTDFSKAFDTVSHRLLIHKMSSYGFNGSMLQWLDSYLSRRYQRVVINGISSSWCKVTSGVPQGSLIGPLLFVLYINDLPDVLSHSSCSMYADDAKLYRPICSVSDCQLLQTDICSLVTWTSVWKMKLNIKKCGVISFTNKKKPVLHDYFISLDSLKRVESVVDLGVFHTSNLSFTKSLNNIVNT
jgi:hypothetical protein